jgi:hypothetical protein
MSMSMREELPAVVVMKNDPSSASVKGMNMITRNTKGRNDQKDISKKGCNVSENRGQSVKP